MSISSASFQKLFCGVWKPFADFLLLCDDLRIYSKTKMIYLNILQLYYSFFRVFYSKKVCLQTI